MLIDHRWTYRQTRQFRQYTDGALRPHQVVERDMLLQEKEKLYKEMKDILARQVCVRCPLAYSDGIPLSLCVLLLLLLLVVVVLQGMGIFRKRVLWNMKHDRESRTKFSPS